MGVLTKNAIAVVRANVKCLITKIFHLKTFKYSFLTRMSKGADFSVRKGSILLGKNIKIGEQAKIAVYKGKLEIGKNVGIGQGNIIVSQEKVIIGEGTILAPNVFIYDHDHIFSKDGANHTEYKTSPVIIGKNVWIGANTVILRGSIIGDNCVVGAGSVIKGEFMANSVIVQKRETTVKEINGDD